MLLKVHIKVSFSMDSNKGSVIKRLHMANIKDNGMKELRAVKVKSYTRMVIHTRDNGQIIVLVGKECTYKQ